MFGNAVFLGLKCTFPRPAIIARHTLKFLLSNKNFQVCIAQFDLGKIYFLLNFTLNELSDAKWLVLHEVGKI